MERPAIDLEDGLCLAMGEVDPVAPDSHLSNPAAQVVGSEKAGNVDFQDAVGWPFVEQPLLDGSTQRPDSRPPLTTVFG